MTQRVLRWLLVFGLSVYLCVLAWHFGQIALGIEPRGYLGIFRELTLYFLVPAPLLLLAALVLRARMAIALALLPIALFAVLYAPRFLPRPKPPVGELSFRVLTFNAGGSAGGGASELLLAAIEAANADIVTLQEVPGRTLEALRNSLADEYPHQAATPDVVTFSVYPLLDPTEVHLEQGSYTSQAVDILIADRVVRLTNVHLRRSGPHITGERSVIAFVRDYDPGWIDGQVNDLLQGSIRPTAGTQIVAGDFNQTEWSKPYEVIANELGDSFREAGLGFGHSYPSSLDLGRLPMPVPLARIDYVFHSADLVATDARVGPDSGSDHLPVIADLAFRTAPQ